MISGKTPLVKVKEISLSALSLNLLLISPLIIQSVPVPSAFLYLTLFSCACLFLFINLKKFITRLIKPNLLMAIFFLYLFSIFIGICVSGMESPIFVIKEFIWGCFSFLTICCASIYFNKFDTLKKIENIFTYSVVIFAGTLSVFAYLKFLIWKEGHIISFLLSDMASEYYPQGSALVGDINFFSLTFLIGALLSFSLWRKSTRLTSKILWIVIFILMVTIGLLSGSRRFFLLSVTLVPLLLAITIKLDKNFIFKNLLSIFIATSILVAANYLINNVLNVSDYSEFLISTPNSENYPLNYYKSTYATIPDESQAYGLNSRITRWEYSMNLLDIQTVLIGDGFHYLTKFGCKFADCKFEDYPHAPILSSILYGGILGLLSFLVLISFQVFIGIKLLLQSKSHFEWGLVLLFTTMFTFVSGNTLLSMPVSCTVTIISFVIYKFEFGETDYEILKRLFDIILSSLALLLLSPIFALIGLIIFLAAGRPIFFCQSRPGLNSMIFKMYKFRTMYNLKDRHGNSLPDKDRLFPLGAFLRSSSLDEFPELWNVLIGDMSLVGPRPLLEEYLPLYSPHQLRRHKVRPGITGWAQINGRNALDWGKKFNLDIWYVENMSFWLDIKILGKTLAKVIKREGISTEGEATAKPFRGDN